MIDFKPPLSERQTDEVIIIAHGSTEEWQQDAIDQAKEELKRRNVSMDEQLKRQKEIEKNIMEAKKAEAIRRQGESYSFVSKIMLVLFWYHEIFSGWYLKSEGYETKHKERLKLLSIGVVLYFFLLLWLSKSGEELE